jgi:hypothetical protein
MDAKELITQFDTMKFAFHPPREFIDYTNHVWPQVLNLLDQGQLPKAKDLFREAIIAAVDAARKAKLWEGP